MKTKINIDNKLLDMALKATGLKNKDQIVEEGLKMLLNIKDQSKLKSLKGKLRWEGNIDEMRTDK